MSVRRYRVNEIFYSLQGEGFWSGTPMVFVRLSGCNLRCPFCDTDHSTFTEMSADEIAGQVAETGRDCHRVCITGGEPALQLDTGLVEALHKCGCSIHLETNGTRPLPPGIDWITLSPKEDVPGLEGNGIVVLESAQEVKLVYDGTLSEDRLRHWEAFPAAWHFLQPCDTGEPERNRALTGQAIGHILSRAGLWRLSLQTHKLTGIR